MKINYKKFMAGIIVLFLVNVAVLIFLGRYYKKDDNTAEVTDNLSMTINSITPNNLEEYLNTHKISYVYFGRPNCSDCNEFEPNFISYIKKYHLENKIMYVNILKIKKDDNQWKKFTEKFHIKYTPTLARYGQSNLYSIKQYYPDQIVQWTPEKGTDLKAFEQFISEIK